MGFGTHFILGKVIRFYNDLFQHLHTTFLLLNAVYKWQKVCQVAEDLFNILYKYINDIKLYTYNIH